MKTVYFDHAAAALPNESVLKQLKDDQLHFFANVEAVHALAYHSRQVLKQAQQRISSVLFGKEDYPVIWGSCATVLFRVLASLPEFRSSSASALEHPALLANLKKFSGLSLLPVSRSGEVLCPQVADKIDAGCFTQVQSETGIIQKTSEIFQRLKPGCRVVDAVQAAGKIALDKSADVWIISGVKFGSPSGAAMILAPNGKFTEKLLRHAEVCRREDYSVGRINVPEMLAMTSALENAVAGMEKNFRHAAALNRFIRQELAPLGIVPTLPDGVATSPYILNMLLPEQESAVVVRALSERGVFIASGSACSAESNRPSATLTALGMPAKKAYRAIRLSFAESNSQEDAEIFISELKTVLKNY